IDTERLVVGARDIEGQAMLVDGIACELRIALGATGVPCLLERTTAARDPCDWAIRRPHEIGGEIERLVDLLRADERTAATGRDRVRRISADRFERSGPVIEM